MTSPILAAILMSSTSSAAEDPFLWLEDVQGDEALEWVTAQNEVSSEALSAEEGFTEVKDKIRAILDSDDKIPNVRKRAEHLYNYWKDADHPRGLWRRTSFQSFRTDSPDWETVLDVDALNEKEGENWVWHGAECLPPEYERCLVSLSRGGADAEVIREFDIPSKSWVEGGFALPEAKGSVGWIDLDTIYVQTDFGEGSMTLSGYPRIVKEWTRGTDLADASMVYEGKSEDMWIGAYRTHEIGYERDFVYRGLTFYTNELYERTKKGLVRVEKPDDASARLVRDRLFLELRKDWEVDGQTFKAGSLVATDYKKFMKGKREFDVLFEPTDNVSMSGYAATNNHILLTTLRDVRNEIEVLTPGKKGWTRAPLHDKPQYGTMSVSAVDQEESDDYWLTVSDYLTPSTLGLGTIGGGPAEVLKQLPAQFDATGLDVAQHFAISKDGTKIPYFQVSRKDMPLDGTAPTLLYGYGGFEISMQPAYSGKVGAGWLERGGVYVVANIRGGGEYGPRWHQAALRENRHRAYEDFSAVAGDLVERGVTSKEHLGIQGGSNGGLLMGVMLTLYPEQWGAVVCQVPLLDMKRYTKLLAGASWAGEYGDPDNPDDWAFIKTFSPYHNIDPDGDYAPILFTTSTRDDRVHPGHARKMAAALMAVDKDVLYYENIEGGHGGAANNDQSAFMSSLAYTFLWSRLTGDEMAEAVDEPEGDAAE